MLFQGEYTDGKSSVFHRDGTRGRVFYYPAGNGRVGFVSVHDVAEAILPFVTGRFGVENRAYTLSHEITYSFDDIAAKLSQYYSGR